jgi:uncharacterized protein (TIGR02646 family)
VRKIEKGSLEILEKWKRANPGKHYRDLAGNEEVRSAIRQACVEEQFGLCAYCCRSISAENGSSHNEHVEPQRLAPNLTLAFTNIVASCNQHGRCGNAHGHAPLLLTPLMSECETELRFELSGLVSGLTERAGSTIRVLALGASHAENRGLVGERKQMVESLIYSSQLAPDELVMEEELVLHLLLEELEKPDERSRLRPYSPVLVNILRQYLLAQA